MDEFDTHRNMPLPEWSVRSDDGGARPSVQFLIAELERGMHGGNRMNITGMNLGIVRTLLNHINKLEDRLDELEGRIPTVEYISSMQDKQRQE